MKLYILILLFCTINYSFAQTSDQVVEKEIMSILNQQLDCWNKGDISCFMQGYWHSDSLMFIGKSGITYGWDNTLKNYKKRYPDKTAMGKLSFDIIKIQNIGKNAFHVTGKWALNRIEDDLNGYFTLLWKKIDGDWKIVMDHSS
ncbi:nuclear transport factor 2 family protein [Candidatus Amoebophilus asiaticus]|nr:nuclear transport factor 2 family protein [Candidatus Amoebophilus asiaticus]